MEYKRYFLKKKDVKKYINSTRVVDEWSEMTEDMFNADSIHELR